jgi:hypothetical protein
MKGHHERCAGLDVHKETHLKPLNWIQRQIGHRTLQMLLKH